MPKFRVTWVLTPALITLKADRSVALDPFSRRLSFQEIEDLIEGALVLGGGGGGDPDIARETVRQVISEGREFRIVDPDALPTDAWVCILGYVGGGVEAKEKALAESQPRVWETPIIQAARELSQYLGVEFDSYLCSEIGAGNTIANFLVAAVEGKAVVDGDAIGRRAKPEMSISLTNLSGAPVTPLVATTHYGDVTILKQSSDEARAEQLCRYLARASAGRLAVARAPSKWRDIKKAVYPGSVSLAMRIGRIIRKNRSNPVRGIKEMLGCRLIFEGEVVGFSREDKGGFIWGDIFLRGCSRCEGQSYRIWFKNENLVSWRDDLLDMTCPDHIMVVDADSGKGLYNKDDQFHNGRKVVVLGLGAEEIWKSQEGLELFGPGHFDFDFPFKPLGRNENFIKTEGEF